MGSLRLRLPLLVLSGLVFVFSGSIRAEESLPQPGSDAARLVHPKRFDVSNALQPEVAAATAQTAASVDALGIPENWEIGLFAGEPDVANVVAFDIDHLGRLFVCESFRQGRGVTDNRDHDDKWLLADLASKTVQDRIDYHRRLLGDAANNYTQQDDRVRLLVDEDGDGKADNSVVYANGFNHLEEGTGAGVLVRGNDVYYSCIPRLWKLSDTDGDGVADASAVLSDGYGVRVAFRGHDLHGLTLGVDGRLYFTIGDRGYFITNKEGNVLANPESGAVFRCELDGSNLEVFATGMRNPQEIAFNDLGDWFTVDNNSDSGDKARMIQLLRHADYGWRMHYQYLPTRGPYNEDRLWEPRNNDQPCYIVPPITNFTDGPCGLAFYPGTGFGSELDKQFLICDFRGSRESSGVRSFQLKSKGAFYQLAEEAKPIWSVLATDVAFGPDGAIYVSDWVEGWTGLGKGRIYRIVNPTYQADPIVSEVAALLTNGLTDEATPRLIDLLSHRDRRIRLEAHWELVNRKQADLLLEVALAVPTEQSLPGNESAEGLEKDAVVNDSLTPKALPERSDTNQLARLHAIWGCEMIARKHPEMADSVLPPLRTLLNDPDSIIRAATAKVLGERGDSASGASLIELLNDKSSRVRYAAIMALAELKVSAAYPFVLGVLRRNHPSDDTQATSNTQPDPAIRHAAQVYLARCASATALAKLNGDKSEGVRLSAVVALRKQNSGEVRAFLNDESLRVVGEAARAIHDEPIPLALEPLASLIDFPMASEGLIRRVLNANYRLGSAESAVKIAKFAARNSSLASMRVFALDTLGQWDDADRRDRVLGNLQPAVLRNRADAAAALATEITGLMSSPEAIREKAITVAAKLGLQQIAPNLILRVQDGNLKPEDRASALMALAKLDPLSASELAKAIRLAPATKLVEASLRVLASHDREASVEKFIAATESRSLDIQQLAWDVLADLDNPKAKASVSAAIESFLDGELKPELHLNVIEAAEGTLDEQLSVRLDEFFEQNSESDPLAKWLPSAAGGNATNGKQLFFERSELSCVRCHKVGQKGGAIGPDLSRIGKQRDSRSLLESICLPNASIAEGFGSVVLSDQAGRIFTGIIKSETDDFLELIQADGVLVRIRKEEIVAQNQGQSAMPADLVEHLNPRELRDLIAYLTSLQEDEETREVQ
ncbi:HEAT repeat protein [Novipirellula aureliae]|uniref:HEAT repeat protein n=1 Tax=Novipirellula aureliae TaxID=2527966 RepID=A0A5C6E840_9BACT|nr:HEAT repeat protein [Novipirellula aureliae]